jgi:hypothetical protein
MLGAVESTTRTLKLPVELARAESVTEQEMVCKPSGTSPPSGMSHVGVGSGSSSASVAVTPDQSAVQASVVFPSTWNDAGRVRVGRVLGS